MCELRTYLATLRWAPCLFPRFLCPAGCNALIHSVTNTRPHSVRRDKVAGLVPAETARNVKKASELMARLEALVTEPDRWLFGEKPTALDAHLVVFIARMTDAGRQSVVPEKLRRYGKWAMDGQEWTQVRDGRTSTMIPPGMSL